jgi:X-Pro dipeptidyl-peptidase
MMNRWFTRYVYGVQNGVEKDPRAWIVRETDDRLKPTPYADYPNPASAPVTLHPQAGGIEMGALTNTAAKQGRETLVDNFSFDGPTLARAEWSNHRLIYATPELSEPVHISGTPRVTIRMTANKPAANLSVWLVALPYTEPQAGGRGGNAPGGGRGGAGGAPEFTSLITRGWADPQNAKSLTKGEPLVAGKFVDVTFNLEPDDQIIPKGKRIAVMIMSSDRDFTLWPHPGTELTIDLGGTSIVLPVVGGAEALRKATAPGTD